MVLTSESDGDLESCLAVFYVCQPRSLFLWLIITEEWPKIELLTAFKITYIAENEFAAVHLFLNTTYLMQEKITYFLFLTF